jgi:hypothetical protein
MKGGDSFGINNASYGSIIIALNTFKYYIKLNYKDEKDNSKSGIYYFIFDITENNELITSFGLTNALIVNGNIDNRNSKTFLDLSLNDQEFSLLLNGNAYKSTTNSNKFNESSGIPSQLEIGIQTNETPTFRLSLGEREFPGTSKKIGDTLDLSNLIDRINKFDEEYKDKTIDNSLKPQQIKDQNEIFAAIIKFADQLDDEQLKRCNEFLKDNDKPGEAPKFILTPPDKPDQPDSRTLYQRALGRIQNIQTPKQPVEKPKKPVVETEKKPAKEPIEEPVPQSLTSKEMLNSNYYNFDLLANKFYNSIKGKPENQEYKAFSNEAFSKLKEFLTENNFLTGNKNNTINDIGKVITILYQYILKQHIKSKGIINDDQLQQILNSLLNLTYDADSEFNGITTSNLDTVWKFNTQFKTKINDILTSINAGDLKGGGGKPNATAIIENNTDNLNISEFSEPVIYVEASKKSISNIVGFGNNKDTTPVFGYLTIGKELILKLLSMQTNANVSFKKPQSTYEKSKSVLFNYALNNPGITIMVATLLTNGITKAIIESGAPLARYSPHVKDIVTSICSNIFGDWVGPYLAVWMPSADRSKSPTVSETWSQIWPKQTGINPMGNLNETIPNSTSFNSSATFGGKSRKSKRLRKSRKYKKVTRSSNKNTRKYKKLK